MATVRDDEGSLTLSTTVTVDKGGCGKEGISGDLYFLLSTRQSGHLRLPLPSAQDLGFRAPANERISFRNLGHKSGAEQGNKADGI